MANPLVAFDESGNSGPDLLNHTQPVFVLASVHLQDPEVDDAIRILSPQIGQEAKFKNMRRSRTGRDNIVSFLRSEYVAPTKNKVTVIHKGYMITAKMVDLLIEPLAHQDGLNLYQQGDNIALANLYNTVMPVFLGESVFTSFQRLFIQMIRKRDNRSVREFYQYCQFMYDSCKSPDYKPFIATIIASQQVLVLDEDITRSLDPAVTSFVWHCNSWGSQFGSQFDLVHDQSKPIKHEQQLLSFLMAKDESAVEIGYDRRKMVLPLKATGIQFGDSKVFRQLQIADVVAGAIAYWASCMANGNLHSDFWRDLDACSLRAIIIGTVWPSEDVTPKDLGTEEVGGIDLVDYTMEFVNTQRRKGLFNT